MPCPLRSTLWTALVSLSMVGAGLALAEDPPKPQDKPEVPATKKAEGPPGVDPQPIPAPEIQVEDIKPLPPVAIPDDPPPHEGAFVDMPITIEPPDILVVEALESLPARPITGERLVRSDGTISLGFYGDVHVRGLTVTQAKAKIVLHLRKYLNDQALGLLMEVGVNPEGQEMPNEGNPNPGRNPFDLDPKVEKKADPVPEEAPPAGKKPGPETKDGRPSARRSRGANPTRKVVRRIRPTALQEPAKADRPAEPQGQEPPVPAGKPGQEMVEAEPDGVAQFLVVDPADTHRVFVDIASHNSRVYYVLGDVGTPGRLPVAGSETVLDALNYAGGFVPTAEPLDIHLYRPARGGKPAKDYKIDLDAIRKGVATANLQVFPNDRLIVGRNPIVEKTIEVDRAVGLFNGIMNSTMQYGFAARTLGVMNSPPSGGSDSVRVKVNGQNMPINVADPTVMTPAQRDAMIKEWTEFFWSISSKEGGAMLDEKAFRDALLKKLTPGPAPK